MDELEGDVDVKTQWEQVIEAVSALGGRATRYEVWDYLKRSQPDTSFSSVTANLLSASVNSPARTSHHTGRVPRRTDTGNRYDRLYKVGAGEGTYFVPYDPQTRQPPARTRTRFVWWNQASSMLLPPFRGWSVDTRRPARGPRISLHSEMRRGAPSHLTQRRRRGLGSFWTQSRRVWRRAG